MQGLGREIVVVIGRGRVAMGNRDNDKRRLCFEWERGLTILCGDKRR